MLPTLGRPAPLSKMSAESGHIVYGLNESITQKASLAAERWTVNSVLGQGLLFRFAAKVDA